MGTRTDEGILASLTARAGDVKKIYCSIDIGTGSYSGAATDADGNPLFGKTTLCPNELGRKEVSRVARRSRVTKQNRRLRLAGAVSYLVSIGALTEDLPAYDKKLKKMITPAGWDGVRLNTLLCRLVDGTIKASSLEKKTLYQILYFSVRRRGYDPKSPCDEGAGDASKSKEMPGLLDAFDRDLKAIKYPTQRTIFHCYAVRDGVLDPETGAYGPKTHTADRRGPKGGGGLAVKGYTAPRAHIEQVLRNLCAALAGELPAIDAPQFLYGPTGRPYDNTTRRSDALAAAGRQAPRHSDIPGAIGQKAPRFDNRGPGQCRVYGKHKVPRVPDPSSFRVFKRPHLGTRPGHNVAFDFWKMIRLTNLRVRKTSGRSGEPLTPEERRRVFDQFHDHPSLAQKALKAFLKNEFSYLLISDDGDDDDGAMRMKSSGRSRFSRPAQQDIFRMLYQGLSPQEAKRQITADITAGERVDIAAEDLAWLDSYPQPHAPLTAFYIPNFDRMESVDELLSSITDPRVRHRLQYLVLPGLLRLRELFAREGIDHKDVLFGLETIRDETDHSFLGLDAKKKIHQDNKKRERTNQAMRAAANELGLSEGDFKKYRLAARQGFMDPYDGAAIEPSQIASGRYEVDHIIPRSLGGSDEQINLVLTSRDNNGRKNNRTPVEWAQDEGRLEAYDKISNLKTFKDLPHKTRALLTAESLEKGLEIINSRSDLNATGYIEKLAADLVRLVFGLDDARVKGSTRQIFFLSGRRTAGIRKKNRLDKILYSDITNPHKESADQARKSIKNRENKKHHYLDALTMAFYLRNHDLKKRNADEFSPGDIALIKDALASHKVEYYAVEKAETAGTLYSKPRLVQLRDEDETTSERTMVWSKKALPAFTVAKFRKHIAKYVMYDHLKAPFEAFVEKNGLGDHDPMPDSLPLGDDGRTQRRIRDFSERCDDIHKEISTGTIESKRHHGAFFSRDPAMKDGAYETHRLPSFKNPKVSFENFKQKYPNRNILCDRAFLRGDVLKVSPKPGTATSAGKNSKSMAEGEYIIKSIRGSGIITLASLTETESETIISVTVLVKNYDIAS